MIESYSDKLSAVTLTMGGTRIVGHSQDLFALSLDDEGTGTLRLALRPSSEAHALVAGASGGAVTIDIQGDGINWSGTGTTQDGGRTFGVAGLIATPPPR